MGGYFNGKSDFIGFKQLARQQWSGQCVHRWVFNVSSGFLFGGTRASLVTFNNRTSRYKTTRFKTLPAAFKSQTHTHTHALRMPGSPSLAVYFVVSVMSFPPLSERLCVSGVCASALSVCVRLDVCGSYGYAVYTRECVGVSDVTCDVTVPAGSHSEATLCVRE